MPAGSLPSQPRPHWAAGSGGPAQGRSGGLVDGEASWSSGLQITEAVNGR